MDIDILVKLSARAWSLKALALLHAGVPGRQAPLLTASGASRTSFVNSLNYLFELGLLERNPGHGHPLRPEFRLTEKGAALAPVAHRIEAASRAVEAPDLLRKMWTLPVLAVTARPKFFSELKRDLHPITDRALSVSLRALGQRDWIERHVDVRAHPPRPVYRAINAGARISASVGLAD